jgi:hypothetical protein
MTNLIRSLHIFFVVGLLLVATRAAALSPNIEEAVPLQSWRRAVQERDFPAASVEFQRAYEAAPVTASCSTSARQKSG